VLFWFSAKVVVAMYSAEVHEPGTCGHVSQASLVSWFLVISICELVPKDADIISHTHVSQV
jgi:hypothetical protein